MLYNKKWKLKHFKHLSIKNTEEIAYEQILTEFNPLEGKDLWLNLFSNTAVQQDQQLGDLQITLQEAIDIITGIQEKMIVSNNIQKETIVFNGIQKEMMVSNGI